jgi:hypothetical protein
MRGTFGRRSMRLAAVVVVLALAVVSAAVASGTRTKAPARAGNLAGVSGKFVRHPA